MGDTCEHYSLGGSAGQTKNTAIKKGEMMRVCDNRNDGIKGRIFDKVSRCKSTHLKEGRKESRLLKMKNLVINSS